MQHLKGAGCGVLKVIHLTYTPDGLVQQVVSEHSAGRGQWSVQCKEGGEFSVGQVASVVLKLIRCFTLLCMLHPTRSGNPDQNNSPRINTMLACAPGGEFSAGKVLTQITVLWA
jgi:hypothetical protein